MARLPLTPPWGSSTLLAANRPRVHATDAGVTITLRRDPALATVMVRRNQLHALVARVREVFGAELARSAAVRDRRTDSPLPGLDPGNGSPWRRARTARHWSSACAPRWATVASVSDQSDGRTIDPRRRPEGARCAREGRCRSICTRGVFRPGDAAMTVVAHIGAHIWQVDETPTYELIVSRSYAAAFWNGCSTSAAEFGYVCRAIS